MIDVAIVLVLVAFVALAIVRKRRQRGQEPSEYGGEGRAWRTSIKSLQAAMNTAWVLVAAAMIIGVSACLIRAMEFLSIERSGDR